MNKPAPDIEHTRSALQGGLSAQLVRNRKFAGKPSRAGVAMMWEPYGTHAVYDHTNMSCTRHAAKSRMWRQNERHSQVIGGLVEGGCRYARRPDAGKVVNGFYELTLLPACQACVRLVP